MKKVPEIRFPEFDGKWTSKKIGDISEVLSSKRVYAKDYVKKGVPFYRGKEISELKKGIKSDDLLYISKDYYDKLKSNYGVPQLGDILITAVGTLGNSYRIRNIDPFYFKDGNLIWLRNIKENSSFIEQHMNSNYGYNQFLSLANGSNQKALTIVGLNKYTLKLPSHNEQEKIANFFSTLNSRITIQDQKINNLEEQRKGYMQRIFSQEIRFKDENGEDYPEWEEKRLGDVLIYERPDKYIVESTEYSSDNSKIPVLTANKAFILGYTEEVNGIYTKGDVIVFDDFTMDFKYVNFPFKVKSSAIKLLTQSDNKEPLVYYAGLLTSLNLKAFNHQRHWISKVQEMYVSIPSLLEQQKIANFLSLFDEKIEIEKKILETLQVMKRGFLQKMFV